MTPHAQIVLARVDEVLRGEACPWLPAQDERLLLGVLKAHVGKENAISREKLMQRLEKPDRTVRDLVNSLRVNFSIGIGSSSVPGASGYYLIARADEVAEVKHMFLSKARSLFAAAKSIIGKRETEEILGQMEIEFGGGGK